MKLWLQRISTMRLWMFLVVTTQISAVIVSATQLEFPQYRWAVPCPSDPSLTGYVSLSDLNTEMRRHSSELSPPLNRIPSQEFRYHLCPQSTFNSSVPVFLPPTLMQYSPVILCGHHGSSIDTCILDGGENHVLLLDSLDSFSSDSMATFEGDDRQSIVMQGIIFQESTDISIAAFSNRTSAQFIDCHWRKIQGRAAIMMANAKPLTWPQVPQPTFVLSATSTSHNIFSSRRRRQLTDSTIATAANEDQITMKVSCLQCSFQNSGKDDFVLLDSYMKDALFIIIDSTIRSIAGSMVINVLHGKLQLVDTSISECSTSIATVRGQDHSTIHIYNSTFLNNDQEMATIAIVKKSTLQMNATQLEGNRAQVAPLVVMESSHVAMADSCWMVPMDANTTAAAVVDATSTLQLERTFISPLSSSSSSSSSTLENKEDNTSSSTTTTSQESSPMAKDCSAQIWNLVETMTCLDSQTCEGTCQAIPLQDQCTIPTNLPTWEELLSPTVPSTPTSGALYQWGTTTTTTLRVSLSLVLVVSHFLY